MTASATPLQTSRVMQIRNGLAFAAAIAFPFLLQPVSPIRNLTFWLPLASLGLVVLVWFSLHGLSALREAATRRALIAAALVVAALAVTRFLPALSLLPARPPDPLLVAVALTLLAGLGALAARLSTAATRVLWLPVALLLVLFILLKAEVLTALVSAGLRALGAQDLAQASASDVNWLGYSYLAFRLLAVLRDRMTGARTLRPYGLAEFVRPDRSRRPLSQGLARALAAECGGPERVGPAHPDWADQEARARRYVGPCGAERR